jgi:outer membrane autotransporter protein
MRPRVRISLEQRFRAWSCGKARSAFIAASLLGLLATAESASAQQQCYGGTISVLSGNNQVGAVNAALPSPLTVVVTPEPFSSLASCRLDWRVTSGTGTLGSSATSITQAGTSSNSLTLGNTQSPVTVTVTAQGLLGTAVFTANVSTANGTTANGSTADGTASSPPALGALAALPSFALISATQQTTNIGFRLGSLRRGGSAIEINLGGLSLSGAGAVASAAAIESLFPAALADGLGRRVGIFINGKGDFGRQDAVGDEPRLDFHTAGFTVGGDYRVTDQFIVGGAVGYLSAGSDVDSGAGSISAQGVSLSAFGTYYLGKAFYVDGIATYGWNFYDTERRSGPGTSGSTARGHPDGTQLALSLNAGTDFAFGALTAGPYGRLDYARVDIDKFREHGDPALAMQVSSQDAESLTTALGVQASYAVSTPWAVLLPTVRGEWQHEFENATRSISGILVSDPATTVSIRTQDPDRDYFRLGAGVSATFHGGIAAFLFYDTVVGRANFTNHGFTGGIRFEF